MEQAMNADYNVKICKNLRFFQEKSLPNFASVRILSRKSRVCKAFFSVCKEKRGYGSPLTSRNPVADEP